MNVQDVESSGEDKGLTKKKKVCKIYKGYMTPPSGWY